MRGAGADRLVVAVKPGNGGGAKGTGRPGSLAGNRHGREEPGERAEAEVVCDLQAGRLGGLPEGQGEQGRGRR